MTELARLLHQTLPRRLGSILHLQRRDEGLLRYLDPPELAHLLLAGLLFVEQLALAGGVAAVAFGGDVLAQRADRLARDDLAADRRLHRNLEHVRRDQLAQLLHHRAATRLRAIAVDQHRERV